MINYIKVIIKYPSEIKIGDYIFFSDNIITEVISIEKGTRHSRENGYPYHFTGKYNDIIYKKTYYSKNRLLINIQLEKKLHYSPFFTFFYLSHTHRLFKLFIIKIPYNHGTITRTTN